VAIKILAQALAGDSEGLTHFEREAKTLRMSPAGRGARGRSRRPPLRPTEVFRAAERKILE
jgi:hypothetical protein